mgnify:CR=1 FL=1
MPKDIQQKDIMGDVNGERIRFQLAVTNQDYKEKEFVKFMVLNMLMFNHIVERKPIQQFT